jgi:hypothetical protein
MNVIGVCGNNKYICEVSHDELEMYFNKYYGNMCPLRVGQEIDLGKGYNHARDMKQAMEKTKEFIEANKKIVQAIINGLSISTAD